MYINPIKNRFFAKYFSNYYFMAMKKIVLIVLLALSLGMVMSSCSHKNSCPAYGETHLYQREGLY